jgi:hypothetical protein
MNLSAAWRIHKPLARKCVILEVSRGLRIGSHSIDMNDALGQILEVLCEKFHLNRCLRGIM